MKKFHESKVLFNEQQGYKFGACILDVPNLSSASCGEFRIRKSDNKMCIIQYWSMGDGYEIFVSE